ncbi:hypothetical protein HK097_000401 [Rhizophlyctis rosea]|uniref:Uncharacterized protein n=1 Tax=Rhizophlyctis rosea TaxID=64517 RepID=A0AAD5S8J8_9FUNG|nr:hypothetical protein HK097_000401 [Rhizophlyctis rosea]
MKIPSLVAYTDDGDTLVGWEAKNASDVNPKNVIYGFKQLLGREFNDTEVQAVMGQVPYVTLEQNGKPAIGVEVAGKEVFYTPEEIAALVLRKLRRNAEEHLGAEVAHAVLAVPSFFNDQQGRAVRDAAILAGMRVERMLSEPTAAAFAYRLGRERHNIQNSQHGIYESMTAVLVFDVGSSCLDVSMLAIDDGVFEILDAKNDSGIGGQTFKHRIVQHLVEVYITEFGVDLTPNATAMASLQTEAERAMAEVSFATSSHIYLPNLLNHTLSYTLTRTKFEELNEDLFQRTIDLAQPLLDHLVDWNHLDKKWQAIGPEKFHIILTGGSSHIPRLHTLITASFNTKNIHTNLTDTAIVIGAATEGKRIKDLRDNPPPQYWGCSDISALSTGIETSTGTIRKLHSRNSCYPNTKTVLFSTAKDNQSSVLIRLYQGERPNAKDDFLIGEMELTGISPAPRGVPIIEVRSEIEFSGVLVVTALERSGGRNVSITVREQAEMIAEPEDIERHVRCAQENAARDQEIWDAIHQRDAKEFIRKLQALSEAGTNPLLHIPINDETSGSSMVPEPNPGSDSIYARAGIDVDLGMIVQRAVELMEKEGMTTTYNTDWRRWMELVQGLEGVPEIVYHYLDGRVSDGGNRVVASSSRLNDEL